MRIGSPQSNGDVFDKFVANENAKLNVGYVPKSRIARKGYPVPALCRQANVPEPECEYSWHPERKYRADYAWPAFKLLVEIDGGLFIQGGHSRGAARLYDMRKDREATLLGWRVMRYGPDEIVYIPLDIRKLMQ
jgi:hypothetical protein